MSKILSWFAENHVAANLLMLTICFAGVVTSLHIVQEVFPEMDLDIITVQVPYLGGTPSEVEESVCIKVEEQIQGVEGIKKITSTAVEGLGTVTVELKRDADPQEALDDIKSEVDRIVTFPEETEEPVVNLVEARRPVMDVVIFGDTDERSLKVLADRVRDDLMALDAITYAETRGTRPYEISIEIGESRLRAYGLTLADVTRAVRANSLDLPGGSVETAGGEILVRTKGQRYTGEQFARVPVVTAPDGTRVTIGDLGTVIDGFEDTDTETRMDGKPAATVAVFRSGDENVLDVAAAVHAYVDEQNEVLPGDLQMITWQDRSEIYRDRMNLLIKNGAFGLLLVFLSLTMFLQMRLAFWVALGILISFLGAFWVLPWFGVTLNMISLFAFIVSLGLVVDDAIVVGENVFARRERGEAPQTAASRGVAEVASPVIFAVTTTIVAFAPLSSVEGTMGKFMAPIPVVVIAVLVFSLVESLLVLPAHLSTVKEVRPLGGEDPGGRGRRGPFAWYSRFKHAFATRTERFVNHTYAGHLAWFLRRRGLVAAVAFAAFAITMALAAAGHVKFTLMPRIESDTMTADLTLPQGATMADARRGVARLESALSEIQRELQAEAPDGAPPIIENVMTTIGSQPRGSGSAGPAHAQSSGGSGANLIEINVQLESAETRPVSSGELVRRWREKTGPVAEAVALTFSADLFRGGKPIAIQLTSPHHEQLVAASETLKDELAQYPGVQDITDSFEEGKLELKLDLRPEASALGLATADLARQVRHGFYGDEALRIQRGRDEVKVMVRFPEDERTSLGYVEDMRIRTPQGSEVPFSRVATAELGRGFATIERADRQRIVTVYGDVDQAVTNAGEVLADVEASVLPDLLARYPGLRYSLEGQERDRAESMQSLYRGFLLALFVIYSLLAVLFRSYAQPLLVMSAIPFGVVGAIWGHILMGWNLTLLSMFGVVALTGVVVNDSLLMIDFINRERRQGMAADEAIVQAGVRRFRPILLTSITTFLGLTPLLLEKSLQAQFLIPMAISLGFGVLFATGITLILVPVSYSLLDSLKKKLGFGKAPSVTSATGEETRPDGALAPRAPGAPQPAGGQASRS